MKFIKYLTEAVKFEEMVSAIEIDCKPFINDWKKLNTSKWLMSGRKGNSTFEKQSVRTDRLPKDTPIEIHEMVDDWFYKKFGVRSRSNSVFVTFNPNMTYRYGNLHLIFPIDQYKAISSKTVEDLFDIVETSINDNMGKDFNMKIWDDDVEEYDKTKRKNTKDKILKKLDGGKYTDKLMFHNNEIMLSCKEYYIIDKEYNGKLLEHFGYIG